MRNRWFFTAITTAFFVGCASGPDVHVDNDPTSADPYDPTDIDKQPDVCAGPSDAGATEWSFYNADCTSCEINEAPDKGDDDDYL